MEMWKEVFNGDYEVSTMGRFRRSRPGKGAVAGRIIGGVGTDGRVRITFKGKTYQLNRIVARAFIGKCPLGKEVNHIDGNPKNNAVKNLEYITPSENMKHAYRLGLKVALVGSAHGNSRLTERKVIKIRKLYKTGIYTKATLGKKFGVSDTLVRAIVNKKIWKHV